MEYGSYDASKRFICEYCGFIAAKKFNLCRHITNCHLSGRKVPNTKIVCALCSRLLPNRDKLTSHLAKEHNQKIETQTLRFLSRSDYELWKQQIECDHFCRYTRNSGTNVRQNGLIVQYLYCHRDGFHSVTPDNPRKRSLKSQGSNKINGACPSRITCKEYPTGIVDVTFVSTHYGHDDSTKRLALRKDERAKIAEKVKKGIPYDIILQSLRENTSHVQSPSAFLVKQNIRNIVRDFKLDKLKGHVNDHYSVDIWSKKMNAADPNAIPILFYKKKDEESNDCRLLTNDVMLIISNEFQTEMLKKFGSNVICTDFIQGSNQNDLNFITILVVDESRTGIPVAFCISNKKDVKMFSVLYEKLRDKVGILHTDVFMSYAEESPYDGWMNVMGHVRYRLINPWSIDKSWRQIITSKVTNPEKRVTIYKTLSDLLHDADTNTFDTLMTNFLRKIMNDPDTKSFGAYFSTCFAYRPALWAYSHIKCSGIDADFRLELVHKTIKSNYLYGKKDNRLDKCIDALMRYIRDCSDRRFGRKPKMQRHAQKKDILIAHQKAHENNWNQHFGYVDEVISNMWLVRSFTNQQISYTVELMQERVQVCNDTCLSVCEQCIPKICMHTFSCECSEYFIRNNICKHIHALVIFLKVPKEDIVIDHSSTFQNDFMDTESIVEVECVTSAISMDDDFEVSSSDDNNNNLGNLKIKLEQIVECLKSNPGCTDKDTNELSQLADGMLEILQNRVRTS